MTTLCYCCDRPATTVEHIPPQCLFPERKDLPLGSDFRRNLVTVPSCRDHNLGKSGDDEYIMYVLTMNLPAEKIAETHFTTKIWRAINRRPALINRVLENSKLVTVHDPKSNELFETAAVEVDLQRIERSLEQIALGLYRHHFGQSWFGSLRIVSEFLRFMREEKASEWNGILQQTSQYADMLFNDVPDHGENPQIFKYRVVQLNKRVHVAIRMYFYGGVKVLALFGNAEE